MAIVLAVAYIKSTNIAVQDYLRLLNEQGGYAARNSSDGRKNKDIDSKDPLSVVYSISPNRIRDEDETAADYLSFMACLSNRDIPQAILPKAESYERQLEVIAVLTRYSLLSRRPTGQALELYRLVHLQSQAWLR